MQRRQLAVGNGAVSREATSDQTRGYLDDTRTAHLVYLRCAAVEPVSQFYTRARRRLSGGDVCTGQGAHGSNRVALGVWMVFDGPTRLAFRNAGGVEREPRTRGPTWMGTGIWILLDVLAGVDAGDSGVGMAVGIIAVEYLACTATLLS